jgi:hypothetical protein
MRIRPAIALLAMLLCAGCGGSGFGLFKSYEYEEEMYLSLDGTATLYVNSSVPALDALRGASFDIDPSVTPDRDGLRAWFESPDTHVTRITFSRRSNRRFVHIRMDVDGVERLSDVPQFSWSRYSFKREGELFNYRQVIGASAGKIIPRVGWRGDELIAFRMHLPSKIVYHNAGAGNPQRGNILSWEQPLSERLRGTPLTLDARMEAQSILYRTLALFGVTLVAVAVLFFVLLWWVLRRGARRQPEQVSR